MYKVVYINEDDVKDTIEAEEFEYGENGIIRIVTGSSDGDENVKYIPTHRLILIEGVELWVPAEDDAEEEEGEEIEEGVTGEEEEEEGRDLIEE